MRWCPCVAARHGRAPAVGMDTRARARLAGTRRRRLFAGGPAVQPAGRSTRIVCTTACLLSCIGATASSRVAYQVSSETCAYFKADLWGCSTQRMYRAADRGSRRRHRGVPSREVAGRLPRRPIARLASDFPGVDPQSSAIRTKCGRGHMTTWGVVVDGVHYAGGCPTRAGPYPFCEMLDLPSYSLAKSVFAGAALMRLETTGSGHA